MGNSDNQRQRSIRNILQNLAEKVATPRLILQSIGRRLAAGAHSLKEDIRESTLRPSVDSSFESRRQKGFQILQKAGADPKDIARFLDLFEDAMTRVSMKEHWELEEETPQARFASLVDQSLAEKPGPPPAIHPAFSHILEQLVPDEALILSLFVQRGQQPLLELRGYSRLSRGEILLMENFSGIGHSVGVRYAKRVPAYLDNLCRLGLLRVYDPDPNDSDMYELLERHSDIQDMRERVAKEKRLKIRAIRKRIDLTDWGRWFCEACSV